VKFIKQDIQSYTSPNIAQEYATWLVGSTYAIGDIVMYGNYFWKNSFTSNIGNIPSEESPYWVKWGVSNYYSLIDTQSTTQTVVSTNLICTFDIGYIDTLAIGYYTAQSIIIENLSGATVLATQTIYQSFNEEVFDYYDYIYAPYSTSTDKAKYFDIPRIGTQLRVSFIKGTFTEVRCGFMVGGAAVDMGRTVDNVKIGWHSYSERTTDKFGIMSITKRAAQDLVDFETIIPSINLMPLRRKAKVYRDEVVAFIVDDTADSIYENIVTLGVMQDMTPIASNYDLSVLSWSILESI